MTSQEIKQTSFRMDGVFLPPEGSTEKPIYFLEVHGYHDEDFYYDFFAEIFLYLKQQKPASNWHGVAVFTNRSFDPGLPPHYQGLTEQFSVVYLDDPQDGDGLP